MIDFKFGRDIGKKFYEDGSVRHFPGNTMVCILDHSSEVFKRAKAERDYLASIVGRTISILPDESLHMTAIEGVCDQVRDKEHWTCKLALDTPLVKVDDFFEEVWSTLPPMGEIRMQFDHLRVGAGCAIALKCENKEYERKIRAWRDIVGDAMGLHFPNHEDYEFHISLSYGIFTPNEEEKQLFEKEKQRFDDECKNSPFSFVVPQPSMTFFNDMFLFNPFRIQRG